MTPTADRQYNIDIKSERTVPKKTPKRGNRDDTADCHVQVHVSMHKRNITAPSEGSDKTFKRRHVDNWLQSERMTRLIVKTETILLIQTKKHR